MKRTVRRVRLDWKMRREIRGHERYQERIQRKYAAEIATARKAGKNALAIDELEQSERHEWMMEADFKRVLETRLLIRTATRFLVPKPTGAGMWSETQATRENVLTIAGERALRDAIRSEQRQRSESVRLWLPLVVSSVAAIAAVLGAVASLLVLLHANRH